MKWQVDTTVMSDVTLHTLNLVCVFLRCAGVSRNEFVFHGVCLYSFELDLHHSDMVGDILSWNLSTLNCVLYYRAEPS